LRYCRKNIVRQSRTLMRFGFICLVGLLSFSALPVFAEDPPPWPEFTFKMGKPPQAGAGKKLITVQIEPEPEVNDAIENAAVATPKPTGTARYSWYWDHVSPNFGVSSAERISAALSGLNQAPDGTRVPGPRLQDLQGIAQNQGATILRETIGKQVSPALVVAVIAVESSGSSTAESSKGAQGLMQLMPDTAARFGVTDSLDPAQNIKGGVAYLEWLMKEFNGDPVLALAGYNAGEGAVKKHNGVPPFAETRDYVPKVLAAFEVARGLCKTRPELLTDACALNLGIN